MDVALSPTLQSLASVVLLLRTLLGLTVTRHARDDAAQCTLSTIAHALSEIAELALGLLSFALLVLLLALLLETLSTDQAAESLLSGADSLIPGSGLAVGIVGCDARAGDRDTANVAAGVGKVTLGVGFCVLLVGCLLQMKLAENALAKRNLAIAYLVRWVARDGAEDALDCTGGLE